MTSRGQGRLLFDENNKKYRTCCGLLHLKKNAYVGGYVTLLLLMVESLMVFFEASDHSVLYITGIPLKNLLLLVGMVCLALMVYAVQYERTRFLIPLLVMQGILHFIICFAILKLLRAIYDDYSAEDTASNIQTGSTARIVCAVVLFAVMVVNMRVFSGLYAYYQFLKEKQAALSGYEGVITRDDKWYFMGEQDTTL